MNFPSRAPDQFARFKRRKFDVVTNSPETVSSKDCQILSVTLSNDTAGALTFSLTETTGGKQLFDVYSVGAQDSKTFDYPYGISMDGGFSIVASAASGVNAEIVYLENARS